MRHLSSPPWTPLTARHWIKLFVHDATDDRYNITIIPVFILRNVPSSVCSAAAQSTWRAAASRWENMSANGDLLQTCVRLSGSAPNTENPSIYSSPCFLRRTRAASSGRARRINRLRGRGLHINIWNSAFQINYWNRRKRIEKILPWIEKLKLLIWVTHSKSVPSLYMSQVTIIYLHCQIQTLLDRLGQVSLGLVLFNLNEGFLLYVIVMISEILLDPFKAITSLKSSASTRYNIVYSNIFYRI